MGNQNTCKDCKDRTVMPNCHMTCEKYLAYLKEREEIRERNKAKVEAYYEKRKFRYKKW